MIRFVINGDTVIAFRDVSSEVISVGGGGGGYEEGIPGISDDGEELDRNAIEGFGKEVLESTHLLQ